MVEVPDITGATLFKASDMSRQQADIQSLRLNGLTQKEISDVLEMDIGSVKSQCSRIDNKKTVRLPEISKVETHARVTPDEDRAVVIWFANDAKIQYRVDEREETIYEETFRADDPHSVYESFDIAIDPDELEAAALETIAEYTNEFRDDLELTRRDWPHVFEAILLISA